jgi:NAD+ kinase
LEPDIDTTLRIQPLEIHVSDARRFVGSRLEEWGMPKAVDVAVLLTSEVVTNAVVHAGPHGDGDEVVVVASPTPIRLIRRPGWSFFHVLRGWRNSH